MIKPLSSTETDELRDARRTRLQNERATLTQLSQQIQSNIAENDRVLREAMALADRLRKTFLPQVETELYDQDVAKQAKQLGLPNW